MDGKRIENLDDVVPIGSKVEVELAEVDPRGKLSLWVVIDGEAAAVEQAPRRERGDRDDRRGGDDRGERGDRRPRNRTRRRHNDEGGEQSED